MQTTLKPPKSTKDAGGPLSSKNGSIAAAAVAAAVAGLLIVFFLQQYRDNVNEGGVPTKALVAEQLIEQGASGDTVGAQGRFKATTVPRDQLKAGAVTDAAALRGKVATADILPGQQLTAADFKPAGRGVVTKLAADERAITIAFDSAHGLIGNVSAGDHVDVLSGFLLDSTTGRQRPVLRMLMQNVLVLGVPEKKTTGGPGAGANATSEVTLRVSGAAAPKLAFAADNGKLWLVLRPQNGARLDRSTLVTVASLLGDAKSVRVPQGRRP
ncbi:MAG: Flp pilus assembly protein CpaB [Solirubrobacteraceae bacterium]